MAKVGRPSDYTPELAAELCALLAQGMSLRTVCQQDGMPVLATVFNWLRLHPEFLDQYTRAKEASADALAEEILDIADKDPGTTPKGETDRGAVDHQRLRVDARKWIASKLKPKKYSDKVQTEHSGTVKHTLEDILTQSWKTDEKKPDDRG